MSWIILFFAGLFEVGWAVGLKYTDGFSRPLPTALTVAAMAISLGLLGLAMKELPLGTAYAIWTGVGAVGTVIAGIILFGESMALFRLASVGLIIAGLIGLKISAYTVAIKSPRLVVSDEARAFFQRVLPAQPSASARRSRVTVDFSAYSSCMQRSRNRNI